MIFDALSNAAYSVLLHGPGAELEGVFKHPRRDVFVASRGPARVIALKLTTYTGR